MVILYLTFRENTFQLADSLMAKSLEPEFKSSSPAQFNFFLELNVESFVILGK